MVNFVHRSRERMRRLGFDEDGSIYHAMVKDYATLLELNAGTAKWASENRRLPQEAGDSELALV